MRLRRRLIAEDSARAHDSQALLHGKAVVACLFVLMTAVSLGAILISSVQDRLCSQIEERDRPDRCNIRYVPSPTDGPSRPGTTSPLVNPSRGTPPIRVPLQSDMPEDPLPIGCLEVPRSLFAEVTKPIIVDAVVWFGSCDTPSPVRNNTQIGPRVKASLVSPSLPGSITPLTEEQQPVELPTQDGHFSWEVRVDKPGINVLSLSISVFDEGESPRLVVQNPREEILLTTNSTSLYEWMTFWKQDGDGLSSIEALVVGIGVVVGAIFGVVAHFRKKQTPTAKTNGQRKRSASTYRATRIRSARRLPRPRSLYSSRPSVPRATSPTDNESDARAQIHDPFGDDPLRPPSSS